MCNFESKVLSGLTECGVDIKSQKKFSIGVAVSGGADSIALLLSLSEILKEYSFPLYVITVNHNIRSAEESGGDAAFVEQICMDLRKNGANCFCKVVELLPGKVSEVAKLREQGIEDAARVLRYEAFESFVNENKLDYLCLAHNKNDQLETLLMRFLQGAGVESTGGIAVTRGKYIRPLIEIERSEIEEYLVSRNITWRTDSTNFDTNYLRNKIRHKLIPYLDEEFCGWRKAVISGGKKAVLQNEVIEDCLETVKFECKENCCSIRLENFYGLKEAVQNRLLMKMINTCGENRRVPYVFLQDVLDSIKGYKSKDIKKSFGCVEIEIKKNCLFVKKGEKSHTDLVFFDIIEESGNFVFPFGKLEVLTSGNSKFAKAIVNDSVILEEISFPFCVRSIQLDDEVECSDGTMKKVADIMSDWHVEEDYRTLIPVFQLLCEKSQPVKAILGSVFGYKDWIVK